MTIFEKQMDFQPSLLGNERLPDTIDLSFITPDMITREREYYPLIGVNFTPNDDIHVPGTEYTIGRITVPADEKALAFITYGERGYYANNHIYNLILPSWMWAQARIIKRRGA